MKAWFKTHAALSHLLAGPSRALGFAQALHDLKFKDGRTGQMFVTPEAQVRAWKGYFEDMEDAHVFEFDDDVALLMTLTDNEPHEVKLPFPIVWLDVEFDLPSESGMMHYQGVLLYESGLPITAEGELITKTLQGVLPAVVFIKTSNGVVEVVHPIGIDLDKKFEATTGRKLAWTKVARKEHRVFTNIVMNFLDLLDTPDVFLVSVKRKHMNTSRESKGLQPLPPSEKVVVQASVRRYIDQLKATGHFQYSHRFWVRGHWHHYRNERYRNRQGEKDWIKPFIKGEGILVKKQYILPTDKRVPEEL
jgi:hypothetical protein